MKHHEQLVAMNEFLTTGNKENILKHFKKSIKLSDLFSLNTAEGKDEVLDYLEKNILLNPDKENIITCYIKYLGDTGRPYIDSIPGEEPNVYRPYFFDEEDGICIFFKYKEFEYYNPIPLSFRYSKGGKIEAITLNHINLANFVYQEAEEKTEEPYEILNNGEA